MSKNMSSMEEQPSTSAPKDMNFAKSAVKNHAKTPKNDAFSILSLSEECKSFQRSFAMAEASLSSRVKEVELKERRNEEIGEKVESLLSDVERMKVELDLREKLVSERVKEVEFREKRCEKGFATVSKEKEVRKRERVLELRGKELSEMSRQVELKEKEMNEGFEACCKEIEVKHEVLVESRKAVGVKERELKEKSKELELRRARMDEERKGLEVKRKEMEEGFKVLELKEKKMNGGFRVLESKEKDVDEERKELEVKRKEVQECLEVLEVKKKEMEEGFKVKERQIDESRRELGLRQAQMDEEMKGLEVKRKEVCDCLKVLEVKKKKMEEGFKALELKERRNDESRRGLELAEKEVAERFRKVKLKEKGMNERYRAMESKEKNVDNCLQAVDLKEKGMRGLGGLTLREKELDKRLQAVEKKEKKMSVSRRKLKSKSKKVDKRFRIVERKEKELNVGLRELESKEKEVDQRSRAVELKASQVLEVLREVALLKKEVDESCQAKKPSEGFRELKLKEITLTKRQQVLELGEEKMYESLDALELKVTQVEDRCKGIELKHLEFVELRESQLNECLEDLDMKVKQIDDCCNEMELKENEIKVHLQANEVKEKQLARRGRLLALREQLIKEKEISEQRQTSKSREIDESCQCLELKEKQLSEVLAEQDMNAMQINDVCDVLMQEQISETCTAVDSSEKKLVEVKEERFSGEPQPETSEVTHAVASSLLNDFQLLYKNMDAEGVRSYLIEHVKESDIWQETMLDALQLASDPAKLVLEVTRRLYQFGIDKVARDDCTAGCVYLLVQLMKMQPKIIPSVQNEAKEFAAVWRGSLVKQGDNGPEIFCFLQFLASYKVAGSYDADELLSLFETFYSDTEVYWPEQIPKFCQSLGLIKLIPDLIQSLVERDKLLQAIMYICAFRMEDAFPPQSLLEAHLKYILRTMEEIVKQGASQDDAASKEISALRAVLKCISSFKLESIYSPAPLEVRIKQLEKEIEVRKSTANLLIVKKSNSNLKEEEKHDSAVAITTCDHLSDAQAIPHAPKIHSASYEVSPEQRKRPCQMQTAEVSQEQTKYPRVHAPHRWIPHSPSFPCGQPYMHHIRPHGAFRAAPNWPGQFGAPGAVYGAPYDMQAGRFAVTGLYPASPHSHTPICQVRGQAQRPAHPFGSRPIDARAFGWW